MKILTKSIALAVAVFALAACSQNRVDLPESERQVSSGKLYEMHLFSPELNETVKIDIWAPENYDATTAHNVLYMHDGQNLFDPEVTWNHQSWNMDSTTQMLIDKGAIPPTIIVGIYSVDTTRIGDLMPEKLFNLIANDTTHQHFDAWTNGKYRGEKYLAFIVQTLKPEIDHLFSTNPAREATAVMGSSMGGLISLAAITEYPEIFGAAGCLSTHINNPTENGGLYEGFKVYLAENLQLDEKHRLYIDCGDQTVDADYAPFFNDFSAHINSLTEAQLFAEIFPGTAHTESDWEKRANIPLEFMFGK